MRRNSRVDVDASRRTILLDDKSKADANGVGAAAVAAEVSPQNQGLFLRFEVKNALLQYQSLCKAVSKFRQAMASVAQARTDVAQALTSLGACRCAASNENGK